MTICIICKAESPKYKCPTCREAYCSVKCCKQHKEDTCEPQTAPVNVPVKKYNYETEDTVPVEKLALLDNNQELRNLLQNRHLRNFLAALDADKNPESAMERAMQEPLFLEFADVCLNIVEPVRGDTPDDT